MEKLDLISKNTISESIRKILEIFPNCVVEAKTEKGDLTKAVDFDLLRQELSDSIVDGPKERYQLNWPGKKEALLLANTPIRKTLRPSREDSVNFEETKNLFVEGDNLDALKLLQETYLGKIKLIYIDPPYNTGRNLIYKNDFSESVAEFASRTGQVDGGSRLVANLESNGRFHSDWLSMIYSRLKVAKNLLAKDGVLICAIDENEQASLSLVLKEIFGEGGYEHASVTIVHNPRGQQGTNISYVHEYAIMVYPADKTKYLSDVPKSEVDSRNLRDSGTESDRTDARNCFYPFIVKDGKIIDIGLVPADDFHPESANVKRKDGSIEIWPISEEGAEKKWRYSRQSVPTILAKLEPKMGRSAMQIIFNKDTGTMRSVWVDAKYDASEYGTKLINKLVPGSGFTFPKSLWTVYESVFLATSNDKDAIVMDFFAGSGTTAHAVMKLNADDGGNRKFIMVQVPQEIDEDAEPYANGYRTIADISRERIRQAGKSLLEESSNEDWKKDIGFRAFKVDSSNIADVYLSPDLISQDLLSDQVDNIKADRNEEDLLFQVLLDWGVDLSLPIETRYFSDVKAFIVDGNALIACFDKNGGVNESLAMELAKLSPLRVVFRDAGFKDDSAKINVEQIFKAISPLSDLKTI